MKITRNRRRFGNDVGRQTKTRSTVSMACTTTLLLLLAPAALFGTARAQYTWHSTVDITPSLTDAAIKDGPGPGFGDHTAYWKPSVAQCATVGGCGLFVFLPGSFNQPRFHRYVANTAAGLGFHAVGLAYSNADAMINICGNQQVPDPPACQYTTRTEVITGQNVSQYIEVSPADSIVNRLVKLLQWLDTRNPTLGWSRFLLNSTTPFWSKITIAGHSQGGGTSQIVGSLFPVHRVVKFAGGVNLNAATYPPFRFTTNADYFTFTHTDDSVFNRVRQWDAGTLNMDVFGPMVSVDGASPPYNGTHMPSTSVNTSNAHGAVSSDPSLAFDGSGTPIYEPVWIYLFGTPTHDVAATTGVPSTPGLSTSGVSTSGTSGVSTPTTTASVSSSSPPISSTGASLSSALGPVVILLFLVPLLF
jgi:hypothetical protein